MHLFLFHREGNSALAHKSWSYCNSWRGWNSSLGMYYVSSSGKTIYEAKFSFFLSIQGSAYWVYISLNVLIRGWDEDHSAGSSFTANLIFFSTQFSMVVCMF